jgi:hypothetical protein
MPSPYSGKCFCGSVHYRVSEEPLLVYACHCTDCQKRTGGAFGLSMWIRRTAITTTKGETRADILVSADGRPRPGRICPRCGTRLWSEPPHRPGLAVVRPGTLDDTTWIRPMAHLWTRSAQPWFVIPDGVPRYDTQPADFQELMALGKVPHE